jgi:hypothetical protein
VRINGLVMTALIALGVVFAFDKYKGTGGSVMRRGA